MENMCLKCNSIWTDTVRHHYCDKCADYLSKLKFDDHINIIRKISINGENIGKGHLQDIHTRVTDDNGEAISGAKGLAYMKKHEKEYAGRLKGYYDPKI